ncbi:hypothetical protein BJX76DRAFT_242815 [Aspergillus varians]
MALGLLLALRNSCSEQAGPGLTGDQTTTTGEEISWGDISLLSCPVQSHHAVSTVYCTVRSITLLTRPVSVRWREPSDHHTTSLTASIVVIAYSNEFKRELGVWSGVRHRAA